MTHLALCYPDRTRLLTELPVVPFVEGGVAVLAQQGLEQDRIGDGLFARIQRRRG